MTRTSLPGPLVGLFVGGHGARMHGAPKGLLEHPEGGTLLDHWLAMFASRSLRWTLVGSHNAYPTGLPTLRDNPPGVGPMGGLRALCLAAEGAPVIALACDMPFVTPALLDALVAHPGAGAVVPRREGRWEPLCARYEPVGTLAVIDGCLTEGRHSLQGLCDALGAQALALDAPSQVDDWDTPEDVARTAADRGRARSVVG